MGKRRECEVCGTVARIWKWATWLRHDGSAQRAKVCPSCVGRAFVFVTSPKSSAARCPFKRKDGAQCVLSFGHRGACELAPVDVLKMRRKAPEPPSSADDVTAGGNPLRIQPHPEMSDLPPEEGLESRIARGVSNLASAAAGQALAKRARRTTRRLAREATQETNRAAAEFDELAAAEAHAEKKAKKGKRKTKVCSLCEGKGSYPNRSKDKFGPATIRCEATGCVNGRVPA